MQAGTIGTFRDFMESALYDPQQGYYSRRASKEDFYTAPELHNAFAEILADEICSRLKSLARLYPKRPLFIAEMGSGDGALARQVLYALKTCHSSWQNRARYVLVERVESLLLKSILSLQDVAAGILGYTRLEDIPPLTGVLFSNELIDAMPMHLLEKRGGLVQEVYVRNSKSRKQAAMGPCSNSELASVAKRISPVLPEGGRHAVNLESGAWIGKISKLLKAGSVITIDYGRRFSPEEQNSPRAFRRHQIDSDILDSPGLKDLTASVDFNALIEEGERHGLKTSSYTSMGRFLLDRGILSRMPLGDGPKAYQERNRIKTLFHPEGMGDVFQVLIQEKAS